MPFHVFSHIFILHAHQPHDLTAEALSAATRMPQDLKPSCSERRKPLLKSWEKQLLGKAENGKVQLFFFLGQLFCQDKSSDLPVIYSTKGEIVNTWPFHSCWLYLLLAPFHHLADHLTSGGSLACGCEPGRQDNETNNLSARVLALSIHLFAGCWIPSKYTYVIS